MTWIQTYTGKQFYPLEPRAEDIDIADIAHALSLICRFTGHCRVFYSVAEHSLLMSEWCKPELAKWALMHDAAEAYLADVARPVKRQIPHYCDYERAVLLQVSKRFGLPWPVPLEIGYLDRRMLATECRDLMSQPPNPWGATEGIEPFARSILPCNWIHIESKFLARFDELFP